ncbi:MAG: DUF2140 family protein [Planctomycetaceae bacterium]
MIRIFWLGTAFAGLLVAGILTMVFLATSQPQFYAVLRSNDVSEAEQKQTEDRLGQLPAEVEAWLFAVRRQQSLIPEAGPSVEQSNPTYRVTLTQNDLNALLMSRKVSGGLSQCRVQLTNTGVLLGCELASGETPLVVSACLQPHVRSDGLIQLDLTRVQIGKLPIPLEAIVRYLPESPDRSDQKMDLNLTASPPNIVLKRFKLKSGSRVDVRKIAVDEGILTFDLEVQSANSGLASARAF